MNRHEVRIVKTISEFEELKSDWNNLLQRSQHNYPFLTFEWQFSWWKSFGKDDSLAILVIYDENGNLEAIVPFCKRKLLLWDIYEFIASDRSDYLDIITPGPRGPILRVALEYLSKNGKWHFINLKNLYLAREELDDIRGVVNQLGLQCSERVYIRSPYIRIQESWDDFLKRRGNGFRKRINKKERRLIKNGQMDITLVKGFLCEDSRIGNIFDTAKKIEKESWKFKWGSPRILTSKSSQEFYSEFLKGFSKNGWLDTWFALLEGVPIAYAFNINYRDKIFAYNSAYDERYKDYGAGSLLHIKRIKNAFEQSLKEYDFLRGEEEYKKLWTESYRELYQVVFFPKGAWTYLAHWACFKIRWRLSKISFLRSLRNSMIRLKGQETE